MTLTMTSDLVLKKSCPELTLILFKVRILNFGVLVYLGMTECRVPYLGHCDLDLVF